MNDFDFDNNILPDFSGARRAVIAFLIFAAIMAALCMLTCGSTVALKYL